MIDFLAHTTDNLQDLSLRYKKIKNKRRENGKYKDTSVDEALHILNAIKHVNERRQKAVVLQHIYMTNTIMGSCPQDLPAHHQCREILCGTIL